jgi:hypothetical protein
MKILD